MPKRTRLDRPITSVTSPIFKTDLASGGSDTIGLRQVCPQNFGCGRLVDCAAPEVQPVCVRTRKLAGNMQDIAHRLRSGMSSQRQKCAVVTTNPLPIFLFYRVLFGVRRFNIMKMGTLDGRVRASDLTRVEGREGTSARGGDDQHKTLFRGSGRTPSKGETERAFCPSARRLDGIPQLECLRYGIH